MGQNQTVSAAAIGIAPHTTAQGLKMLPMNMTVTASAAMSGQSDGPTPFWRYNGSASMTEVTSTSRLPNASPSSAGSAPGSLHSGAMLSTVGV